MPVARRLAAIEGAEPRALGLTTLFGTWPFTPGGVTGPVSFSCEVNPDGGMAMSEAVSKTGYVESDPGLYILPIRYGQRTAAETPRPVEWWEWMPSKSASFRDVWVRVRVYQE